MNIANLSFAAGPEGLPAAVASLEEQLGAEFKDGGFHPRFGTRNHILPLTRSQYLEVVEVLEHPAAEKAPFGQAVRARTEMGGGWLGWVMDVDDLQPYIDRLQREPVHGSRQFPDGRRLEWEQLGVKGLLNDPQLPYFIKWISEPSVRPSALGEGSVELAKVEIAGNRSRVSEWLGFDLGDTFGGVEFEFTSPHGQPGIDAVTFRTLRGLVRI
ncbi:VOC family protein [Nigerium massiliense]|uniref:VOC family protein n=1 Tax=Nigerium massiliense TaxID=1522317 RepID=UPI00058AD5DF|nr:VOC family protein [Nigerium massiliense]